MSADDFNDLPDEALVERFRATHDDDCFTEVFRRYRKPVFAACWRMLRNTAAAEDMTQETFRTAFTKIDSYREGSFSSWLRKVAQNLCLNHLEATRREVQMEAEDFPVVSSEGPARLLELTERIQAAFQELSRPQRICLKLFGIDGYRYKEIVKITGFSDKEVKTHLQNGMRRFRLVWSKTGRPESEEVHGEQPKSRPAGSRA